MENAPAQQIQPIGKKELYQIMQLFETQPVSTDEEDFEDLTAEIFSVVDNQLEDLELLCDDTFSFEETMTSYEYGSPKMDLRLQRHKIMIDNKPQFDELEQWTQNSLSQSKKLALMKELLFQYAHYQDQNGYLQQTVYSCLVLSKKRYYQTQYDLLVFVEALNYIILSYNRAMRSATIFRDEDITWPITMDSFNDLPAPEIFNRLQEIIQRQDGLPKEESKAKDKENKEYSKCFKLMQALMVLSMHVFDFSQFTAVFFPLYKLGEFDKSEEELEEMEKEQEAKALQEQEEQAKEGKKKKNKKNKKKEKQAEPEVEEAKKDPNEPKPEEILKIVDKYVENLAFKIFEEKQEKHENTIWARAFFNPLVHNSIPSLSNKKVFAKLDYKQVQQFFGKIFRHTKDLIQISKSVHNKAITPSVFLFKLDQYQDEKPCPFTRLLYQTLIFPSNYIMMSEQECQIQQMDPRSYLFFTNKCLMIRISDFVLKEVCEIYPAVISNLTDELFMEFYDKYCIMFRENVFRTLRNLTRQRRSFKRYFEDIQILVNEANWTDDQILKKNKQKMNYDNTPCLVMSINLFITQQRLFLQKGFLLELLCPNDLPEHFYYLTSVYEMQRINRQQIINSLVGGRDFYKFINYENLNQSHDWFINRREQFTENQKMMADEVEWCQAMAKVSKGLYYLSLALRKKEIIKDYNTQWDDSELTKDIRERHYDQRFGFFKLIAFPKYKSYQQYQATLPKEPFEEMLDIAKNLLLQGKQILQNLEQTDQKYRNTHFLKNEELKKMQVIIVANSLQITKVKLGQNSKLQVKIDMEKSHASIPAIDIYEKK